MNHFYMRIVFMPFLVLASFGSAYAGCDPCIQAAAQSANAQMTTAINAVTTSVQANVTATQALNASVQATNATLQTTINLNTQQLLQGLDASTNRVELSIQQNTKTAERLTDHTMKTMVKAIKDARIAEEIDENNKIYSQELAQPLSGEIGANRAPLLKQGFVQSDQVWKQMVQDMQDWSEATGGSNVAGQGAKKSVLLTESDDVWNPTPLVNGRQLTLEESINMQKLLTLIVNPVPLPRATDEQLASSSKASEYEFERRLINTKLGMAHSVLAKSIADKHPLISMSEDDWKMGYIMAEPDANGKVSIQSMLESETIGRLGSEGWYQDIKTKTPAGISREQVYQQAINNLLLLKLVEQEEQKLTMLSLMSIAELEKSKPVPPTKGR